MSSQRTVLFGAAALCAVGLLGYAVYFDYKRRNDVEFRKQLRMPFLASFLANSERFQAESRKGFQARELAINCLLQFNPPFRTVT